MFLTGPKENKYCEVFDLHPSYPPNGINVIYTDFHEP